MTKNIFNINSDPFFIAEIGGNHEGCFKTAISMTRLALEAGVDAVKFQLYKGDSLVNKLISPERNRHFRKFELDKEQYISLANMIIKNKSNFMASVWDSEMLNWIDPYIKYHKVGSGDLTCYPLIKKLMDTGKPIIISTGLSTIEEVKNLIDFIYRTKPSYIDESKIALLQCTSSYPTPDSDVNLNAMLHLKDVFNLPVGYSDHSEDTEAVLIAVSMGAQIIEKHFTDTRENKIFRYHKVSITKEEYIDLKEKIKRIKSLQGNYHKKPSHSEVQSKHNQSFRRALYAKIDIKKGEIFTEENIDYLRPLEGGLCASRYYEVIGKKAPTVFNKGEPIIF